MRIFNTISHRKNCQKYENNLMFFFCDQLVGTLSATFLLFFLTSQMSSDVASGNKSIFVSRFVFFFFCLLYPSSLNATNIVFRFFGFCFHSRTCNICEFRGVWGGNLTVNLPLLLFLKRFSIPRSPFCLFAIFHFLFRSFCTIFVAYVFFL